MTTDTVRSVVVVMAEPNRAFRSTARTVMGILQEGQLAGRCRSLEARDHLGSVALETIADQPDFPIKNAEEALVEELALTPPLALVAIDPLAAVLVTRWAEQLGDPLTIGVVGSLWLDPLWHHSRLDRLIVPDQSIARSLHDGGRDSDQLVPIGLGVCGRFGIGVREGRQDCRRTLKLPPDRPVLLMVTETLWADDVPVWLEATAGLDRQITVLVDAAGDRLALRQARRTHERLGLDGMVFGRADDAGLYWGAADRVVGRALDGLTTRALAFRCPMWAIRPADDRQRGIVAGLEKLGAGSPIHDAEALAVALRQPGWEAPLDASRLETMAGAGVPQRIAEAITQMAVEREASA